MFLKFPSLEDKDMWIDYTKERTNSDILPISYEEWLERKIKDHLGKDLEEDKIPTTVFLLIDFNFLT